MQQAINDAITTNTPDYSRDSDCGKDQQPYLAVSSPIKYSLSWDPLVRPALLLIITAANTSFPPLNLFILLTDVSVYDKLNSILYHIPYRTLLQFKVIITDHIL